MSLQRRITRIGEAFMAPPVPTLNTVESAISRVMKRWPDVISDVSEQDREILIQKVRTRYESGNWRGTKLSMVTQAARILFDKDFRERDDLSELRQFYFEETRVSSRPAFVGAMMSVFISSYEPGASHAIELSYAIGEVRERLGAKWLRLLDNVPDILSPLYAHESVAQIMANMSDPWSDLRAIGIPGPHAPGLMDHVHLQFLKEIGPRLGDRKELDRLFRWMKPPGQKSARSSGATETINAVLTPWTGRSPDDGLRSYLVEQLVALFGDPRVGNTAAWHGVEPGLKSIMMRWLTGEDIRFFLDVVSAVEDSHMWAPRRKFWLGLHDRRMIDEAWVAFSSDGARHARSARQSAGGASNLSFGRQDAGGNRANTSLLIMKISNSIVVEGSHSYKVHIFKGSNERAPKLFQRRYDCENIRTLPGAETVIHNGNWQARVVELIGYRA